MSEIVRFYAFKKFERLWHWCQSLLIIFMLITGFEIHGTYTLLGFESAVELHGLTAWALMGLWIFVIFWHLTTGEWRHYVPTTRNFFAMIYYYAFGIFSGSAHPFQPSEREKHNPLQRLTYLMLGVGLMPAIWVTGLLSFFHDRWDELGLGGLSLAWVAGLHTLLAFAVLSFLLVHVYLITTGPRLGSQLRAMVTGWEEVHSSDHRTEDPGQ
jgi:thiosulfate reductase cytochrome b subunit